ncbi:MAG TPA: Ig-like domain-containing protein [Candidatus Binatia bacterium]|nr:Ig-like domain-containing protein [Candidatus Binatia bacterium]
MYFRISFSLLLCLLCSLKAVAAEVQVVVIDGRGNGLNDALVIVQELGDHQREVFRALTDERGNISPHALEPGLYRAIATYPYSQRETTVREFLVRDQPVKVQLRMAAGQSIEDLPVSIGRLTVHVVDANGQPATGARVLVRDAEAHSGSEHWGTTNAQGTTTLELTMTPAVLVVVYRDHLYSFPASGLDTERTLRLK